MNFVYRIIEKHNLVIKVIIIFISASIIAFLLPNTSSNAEDAHILESNIDTCDYSLIRNTEEIAIKSRLIDSVVQIQRESLQRILSCVDSLNKSNVVPSFVKNSKGSIILSNGDSYSIVNGSELIDINDAINYVNEVFGDVQIKNGFDLTDFLCLTYVIDNNDRGHKFITKNKFSSVQLIKSYSEQKGNSSLFFKFLFSLILSFALFFYLYRFRKSVFGQNKEFGFLFLMLVLATITVRVLNDLGFHLYYAPILLFPLIIRSFFDSRTALFTHLLIVVLAAFFSTEPLQYMVVNLITLMTLLFSIKAIKSRHQIITASVVAILSGLIIYVIYNLAFGNSDWQMSKERILPFIVSGSSLVIALPSIYFIEWIFGFYSDFKLLELSDLNQPLLRKLSQEVPGTFQHSLQVANLAEEVIFFIGGNTLLTRTGAMYHDIGKIYSPEYFIENQLEQSNPHEMMLPKESAKVIIDHVIKGIELARENKIPDYLIDFIRTHHGTSEVRFFLHLQKEQSSEIIDESDFKYPGPIPFNKETAVVMLADAIEAASRSLKVKSAEAIDELVEKIIRYKVEHNQLINSDLTFKDITLIKKIFKKRLMTIYHVRIEYPS
ncbi:MAG: HD family phosphohydrolase [Bacteroidia bacterium]